MDFNFENLKKNRYSFRKCSQKHILFPQTALGDNSMKNKLIIWFFVRKAAENPILVLKTKRNCCKTLEISEIGNSSDKELAKNQEKSKFSDEKFGFTVNNEVFV